MDDGAVSSETNAAEVTAAEDCPLGRLYFMNGVAVLDPYPEGGCCPGPRNDSFTF